ncbi:hypothetical protein SAMN05216582_1532 [Selenomonas ruminantium]|uniref:Uncharacterized protein n=1 Tax=Selenomonas ruminantium TaxID=971 RepID=A0A1M6Y2B6_SELRU|nr:hypothetical protein [Selenomonas ruminantium]SHL12273.1 hypothetical protein SAMN05216582_1532 [Selenomonas ruminantium]
MDLPAHIQERWQAIDWAKVQEKVADYGPVLQVIKDTWDKETLAEISQGNLFVADDVLNDIIAKNIRPGSPARALRLQSRDNGQLSIAIDTVKFGQVELSGEIREFVHDGDKSYLVYQVRQRNLPNKGLMSWAFSRISLAMAQRMVGSFQLTEDLPMEIRHNTVRIDYSKALADSAWGKNTFHGQRLQDIVIIEKATPREGGIMFQTKLNLSDRVKKDLQALLH